MKSAIYTTGSALKTVSLNLKNSFEFCVKKCIEYLENISDNTINTRA